MYIVSKHLEKVLSVLKNLHFLHQFVNYVPRVLKKYMQVLVQKWL